MKYRFSNNLYTVSPKRNTLSLIAEFGQESIVSESQSLNYQSTSVNTAISSETAQSKRTEQENFPDQKSVEQDIATSFDFLDDKSSGLEESEQVPTGSVGDEPVHRDDASLDAKETHSRMRLNLSALCYEIIECIIDL